MEYKILDGAIFIADSHENENRQYLLEFLRAVRMNKLKAPQIFLMGDMFDYLSCTDFAQEFYKEQISLINEISKSVQVFYFEGNHDFNLKEVFPYSKVFSIHEQPVKFSISKNKIELAHGDKFMPDIKILMILRNKFLLKIMNFFDKILKGKITIFILNSQKHKNLYKNADDFKKYIEPKIHHYSADFVLEGHFHQDKSLEFQNLKYINLNSYAVTQKIYRIKIQNNSFSLIPENLNLK